MTRASRLTRTSVLALAAAACLGPLAATLTGVGGAERAVTRVVHAEGAAAGAPGRALTLSTVTVPPGAVLARHRHPGTQIATITRGRLTYTVHVGEVEVYRPGPGGAPRLVRRIGRGATAVLGPGSTVVEQPGDIHHAANRGHEPVRISLASLFPKGAPSSIPVPGRTACAPGSVVPTARPAPRVARPSATGHALAARFLRLLATRDRAGLDAFLSPAFQLQRADGTGLGKRAYLAGGLPDIDRFRITGAIGTQAGATLVVRYKVQVVGTVGGESYAPGPAPRLSVFTWDGRCWRLMAHANFNPSTRP